MYDRTIGGESTAFGNNVGLYMQAMTMYDHETGSIWSQVLGCAIRGELTGSELSLLPAAIESWQS